MTIQEIYNRMKASFLSKSGLASITEPGVIASIVESLATEIKFLYDEMSSVIQQGYVVSATGEYLDKIGALIGCDRKDGTKATGTVTFTATSALAYDIVIPEDTVVSTVIDEYGNRYRFRTISDVILVAGDTSKDATVEAYNVGDYYNLPAHSLIIIETPIAGIVSCTNSAATTGGTAEETDEEYRERIPIHLASLKRSTAESLISAALSVDGINSAQCFDGATAGTATVVVSHTTGTVPPSVIDEVEAILEEYKGAGIQITVSAATNVDVSCTFDLYLQPDVVEADVKAAAEAAVEEYLNNLDIGDTAYWSHVVKTIVDVDGVVNVKNVLLNADVLDITATSVQKIVPDTITGTVIT